MKISAIFLCSDARSIFTSPVTITFLHLIQSAVGISLDSRNTATASKPNVICAREKIEYSEHMLCTHSPLIIRASTETQYFAAMAALNVYVVHDLNSLDTYTLCTVHEQDSVVARHERKNYHMLLLVCYTAHIVIRAYIAHMLLMSILQNFSSNSHAGVKFKLSCTVC